MQKKLKVWSRKTADDKFSVFIRERDKKCARCGRTDRRLNCSHYWNRVYWITRFDPDNCIALCAWCHTLSPDNWEADRNSEYKEYMIQKLGKERFDRLKEKHFQYKSKYDSIKELMEFLKKDEPEYSCLDYVGPGLKNYERRNKKQIKEI
ncbi:MAG: recombination protein NinG [Atribacterota bacterium]|nr:recombination protein NinG [Atribacterota bacterium]